MGAVVDVLHVGEADIEVIKRHYPNCTVIKQSKYDVTIQRYRLLIPNENEETYYCFLLAHGLATSSSTFCSRVANDPKFAETMRINLKQLLNEAESKLPKAF